MQQALLESSHPSPVAFMIVAEKVQQSMQSQDSKLNSRAMAMLARLALGHTGRNHDLAEKSA